MRIFKSLVAKAMWRYDVGLRLNRVRKEVAANHIRHSRLLAASIASPRINSRSIRKTLDRYDLVEMRNLMFSLRGKRVALIGPGSMGSPNPDLRNFDVIARLGFTGADSAATREFTRCDINFLARWHASQLVTKIGEAERTLDTGAKLMLRWDVWEEDELRLQPHFQTSRFSISPCDELFGAVTPNFAPHVILWLLACQPKELHLTHMDLFTQQAYSSGYAVNKEVWRQGNIFTRPPSTVRRSFAEFHNPFTHFDFFRSLKSFDQVTFSETLESVISQGKSKYRKRIAQLYFEEV